MKKQKQAANKKSTNDQLAVGAEEIRKLQKRKTRNAQPKVEPLAIPECNKSIEDVLKDRVTMLPGSVGLKIADDTPIEENLMILDYATTLGDHVGFMIGDVINAGEAAWGKQYDEAVIRTGRARNTLEQYASVARRIAPEDRQASLGFEHHREILRLVGREIAGKLGEEDSGDVPKNKVLQVLKEVGEQAKKGKGPTVKELRIKIQKLTPRKPKAPKKVTSGKPKKKNDKPPPYEPSADEQARLDSVEDKAGELAVEITSEGGVFKIAAQLDNKTKHRLLKLLEPIVTFYNKIDRCTGY